MKVKKMRHYKFELCIYLKRKSKIQNFFIEWDDFSNSLLDKTKMLDILFV